MAKVDAVQSHVDRLSPHTSSVACNVWKMALAVDVACLATLKIFVTTVSTKSIGWLETGPVESNERVCTDDIP